MKNKLLMVLLLLFAGLMISGCRQRADIVIASKPMTEQFILAEMLIALIETHTDLSVEHRSGIGGGTTNIHPAMISGDIDLYPEYTGTGWMQVLQLEFIADPTALYLAVKEAYDEEFDITWTGLYGFNNGFGIAMKRSLAESMGISTYSDLFEKGLALRFAANYDFYEREDGYPGLTATYGAAFDETFEMQIGLVYTAIGADQVDVAIIFTTDGRLEQYDLVVLEDDLNYFTSYDAATLVRNETLEKFPELLAVLEMLTGQISDAEMTNLNYQVEIEGLDPKVVALNFLNSKGLLD
ncbi:MAG: glycine/betaine ABC transporter substrate-binding protein [Acholeplasmataceae bacterium]|nr:MAG: glycine/betaine ABC transporter substrate-binding protein [Acholeplasmataceae bacterium]